VLADSPRPAALTDRVPRADQRAGDQFSGQGPRPSVPDRAVRIPKLLVVAMDVGDLVIGGGSLNNIRIRLLRRGGNSSMSA